MYIFYWQPKIQEGSPLLLDVASYVLLLTTHEPVFALTLVLAWLQMPVWAILLVKQLRIFASPAQPDRSFKFKRTAYIWLLVATFMMRVPHPCILALKKKLGAPPLPAVGKGGYPKT